MVPESSWYSGGTAQGDVTTCHNSFKGSRGAVLLRPNAARLNGKKLLEGLRVSRKAKELQKKICDHQR